MLQPTFLNRFQTNVIEAQKMEFFLTLLGSLMRHNATSILHLPHLTSLLSARLSTHVITSSTATIQLSTHFLAGS